VGKGSDFLETQIGIMPQYDYLALVCRNKIEHHPYPFMTLLFNHFFFGAVFHKVQRFQNISVVAGINGRGTLYFTEMVYTKVMSNSDSAWKEFSFFSVTTGTDSIDNLNQYILKNIFSKIFVFN